MSKKFISMNEIFWFYLLYFLVMPFGFIIRTFYSRTLSIEEFGVIYGIIGFFGFLSLFVNMGYSASLRYYIPKYLVKKDFVSVKNCFYYSFLTQLFLALIIGSGIFLFADFISLHYFHNIDISNYLKIFVLYFISINLVTSLQDIFISLKLNIHYQLIIFLKFLLIVFFSLGIFIFDIGNLYIYSWAWSLATFIMFVIYFIHLFRKFDYLRVFPQFKFKLIKNFYIYAFLIFFGNVGNMILNQTDLQFIIYYLGSQSVALYSNIFSILNILVSLFGIIIMLFGPIFVELKELKDFETLRNIFSFLYNLIPYLMLPFIFIIGLYSDLILKILFGSEYSFCSYLLSFFIIFLVFKIFIQYNISYLTSAGEAKLLLKIILPTALLNLILNFILIKFYGIYGVAFSTVLGWLIIFGTTLYFVLKEIKFKLDFAKYLKIVICLGIFIVLVQFLKQYNFLGNYYLYSGLVLAVSLVVYFILGYFLRIYQIQELYIFIPDSKIKIKIRKIHGKYFNFLK